MAFSPDQIQIAARAWLNAVRREWVKRNPDKEGFIPPWETLTVSDRQWITTSITAALIAADPKNVQLVLARDAENEQSGGS